MDNCTTFSVNYKFLRMIYFYLIFLAIQKSWNTLRTDWSVLGVGGHSLEMFWSASIT